MMLNCVVWLHGFVTHNKAGELSKLELRFYVPDERLFALGENFT